MSIQYMHNDKTNTTIAIMKTANSPFPAGVDPVIAERMIEDGKLKRKEIEVPRFVKASTTLQDGDEYDRELGERIARDKAISKLTRIETEALVHYHYALQDELHGVIALTMRAARQGSAARERLAEVMPSYARLLSPQSR